MRFACLAALWMCMYSLFGQDIWIQKDSIKGPPRSGIASFVLGNRGYVVGGFLGSESSRKMYSYSKNQDDWDDELSLGDSTGGGLERHLACGFSMNNKGYITLGQGLGAPFMKDLWEFDKATQTWTQKADFPGTPRRAAASFVVNGFAYIGTGEDAQGLCNDMFRYDPLTNLWDPVSSFPGGGRRQAAAFELNGYGWIATGDGGMLKNDLWSYNTVTDLWQQKADLPGQARAGAVAWSTSPSAYVATGQNPQGEFLGDVWQYNYYQNAWVQKNDFGGGPRTNACAFVINGSAFLGGGYNGNLLDDFYGYTGLASAQEEQQDDLEVFPNPSNGTFYVRGTNAPIHCEIMGLDGRKVSSMELTEFQPASIEGFPSGTYLLHLSLSNRLWIKCIVKQ